MSITFELEIRGTVEALNLSNPNAAALMTLAGLAPQAAGEVRGESLRACVARLLRVVNCEAARAHAIAGGTESLRWCEGGRSDEYLQRRAAELLALLVSAQRQGCGVGLQPVGAGAAQPRQQAGRDDQRTTRNHRR